MKLISLNVEGSEHWDLIGPFLEKERPDVLCLQETFEADVVRLGAQLSMDHAFAPMTLRNYRFLDPQPPVQAFGVAMLSRTPFVNARTQEYHSTGKSSVVPYDNTDLETRRGSMRQVILSADISCNGEAFPVATTHFTWTPDGMPNRYQEEDAAALLDLLAKMPDTAVCGDFNMPRRINPLYERFAEKYEDAIPPSYISSVDIPRHRLKNNPAATIHLSKYMIDYLFLPQEYRADDVRLQPGVSDHYAIVATLRRNG